MRFKLDRRIIKARRSPSSIISKIEITVTYRIVLKINLDHM